MATNSSVYLKTELGVKRMANMCRCKKGLHIYDADKHTLCPHCSSAVFDFNEDHSANKVTRNLSADEEQSPPAEVTRIIKPSSANSQVTRKLAADEAQSSPVDVTRVIKRTDSSSQKTRVLRPRTKVRLLTAWLVIIEGPGKGAHLPLFYGMNSIGRSKYVGEGIQQSEQEVCLDFGLDSDSEIARESQANLTYDKNGTGFLLQHGGGNTLTYLNGAPVLEAKLLSAYDRVGFGKTVLMFIPFCGEKFQWPGE